VIGILLVLLLGKIAIKLIEKERLKMFCPDYKSEFIEGITSCPVYEVKLIDELPLRLMARTD